MSGMLVYVTLPGYYKEPIYLSLTATVEDFCRAVLDKTGVKIFEGFGFTGQNGTYTVPKASGITGVTGVYNVTQSAVVTFDTYVTGTPAQPTGTADTLTGSLGAASYYVKTTYVDALGESLPSVESAAIVLGGTGKITINSPAANPKATGWNAYISAVSGSGWKKQNGTLTAVGSTYIQSTALSGAGAVPPVADTTSTPVLNTVTIDKVGINSGDEVQFWSSPAF